MAVEEVVVTRTIEAVTNIVEVGPTTTAMPVLVGSDEEREGVAAGERELLDSDVDEGRAVRPDTDEDVAREEVDSVEEEMEEEREVEGVTLMLDTGVEDEAGMVAAFIWTSTLRMKDSNQGIMRVFRSRCGSPVVVVLAEVGSSPEELRFEPDQQTADE